MDNRTFSILNDILHMNIEYRNWGLIRDVASSKEYFFSNENYPLEGDWLYVFIDKYNDIRRRSFAKYHPDYVCTLTGSFQNEVLFLFKI